MSCVRLLPQVQHHLDAWSTTAVINWFTPWQAAVAMDAAAATMKIANTSGGISLQVYVQLAESRIDKPSAAIAVGTGQTTDIEYYISAADFDLATVVPGNAFIRFGVGHKITGTPPTQGQADVTLEVTYQQCGMFLPAWANHLVAVSTTKQFIPISGWMPALGVVKIGGVVVATGRTGNIVAILTFRVAETSTELPDPWDDTGIGSVFSNGEQNTDEIPVTTTGNMWVQIGVMYFLSSGTTPGNLDLSILLGIRSAA